MHLACGLAEFQRLTASRRRMMNAGDVPGAGEMERRINALLQESWICSEPGCDDRVTLGMLAAQKAEAPR